MIICEICLKAGVCRYKNYRDMLNACDDLRHFLYYDGTLDAYMRTPNFNEDIKKIENHLNPTRWQTAGGVPFIKIASKGKLK